MPACSWARCDGGSRVPSSLPAQPVSAPHGALSCLPGFPCVGATPRCGDPRPRPSRPLRPARRRWCRQPGHDRPKLPHCVGGVWYRRRGEIALPVPPSLGRLRPYHWRARALPYGADRLRHARRSFRCALVCRRPPPARRPSGFRAHPVRPPRRLGLGLRAFPGARRPPPSNGRPPWTPAVCRRRRRWSLVRPRSLAPHRSRGLLPLDEHRLVRRLPVLALGGSAALLGGFSLRRPRALAPPRRLVRRCRRARRPPAAQTG